MYITRKVFSAREEDIIAAIEERAFSEGYEYAQKEFGMDEIYEEDYRRDTEKRAAEKRAAGLVGGGYLGHKAGKRASREDIAKMERDLKTYKNLSPEEKKEMRDRQLREEERRQAREDRRAQAAAYYYR